MYYMFPAFNVFYILKKKPINYLNYTNIFTLYVFLSLIFFFYNIVFFFSNISGLPTINLTHMQLTSHICNRPHKHPVNLACTKSTSHTCYQPHTHTINLIHTQSTSCVCNWPHTHKINLTHMQSTLYSMYEVDCMCVRSILCVWGRFCALNLTQT